ncbi:MAG: cytochrome c [Bacteroidia bacterium]
MKTTVGNPKAFKIVFPCLFVILILGSATTNFVSGQNTWKAPASADKIKNPLTNNSSAIEAGKQLYVQLCAVCHGNKGKGDGIAGMTLNPRPANFTKNQIQAQSDGALYWKLTEGRPPMASYKAVLKEEQRWQLVNYLRTFKKN